MGINFLDDNADRVVGIEIRYTDGKGDFLGNPALVEIQQRGTRLFVNCAEVADWPAAFDLAMKLVNEEIDSYRRLKWAKGTNNA